MENNYNIPKNKLNYDWKSDWKEGLTNQEIFNVMILHIAHRHNLLSERSTTFDEITDEIRWKAIELARVDKAIQFGLLPEGAESQDLTDDIAHKMLELLGVVNSPDSGLIKTYDFVLGEMVVQTRIR